MNADNQNILYSIFERRMEELKIYNFFIKKSNWFWHTIYWMFAACLMFFIFSNRDYDFQIRLVLVSLLIFVSYLISLTINNYLIPQYLFKGKFFVFTYGLFGVFIFTLWIISFSVYIILLYSSYYLPNVIIPKQDDIIILIAGNYLIVTMVTVIHFIKESYRRLIEKSDIEKQKQITELKLKEANLKLLQGQIHPHFLFNMLNNLYGLVNEDVNVSREVIVKLSDLLDYMLYECDKSEVLLESELAFIKNYIELERVRHDADFNVQVDFQSANEIIIAPLILFPFVENAFKHGFHNPSESFINMNLNINDDKIRFSVENHISDIRQDKYLNQERSGIGLNNIQERLKLIYKNNYFLNITNDDNIYKVSLEIMLS